MTPPRRPGTGLAPGTRPGRTSRAPHPSALGAGALPLGLPDDSGPRGGRGKENAIDQVITCAARPCSTCPYRLDVPSGVWGADEYAKLPRYDGDLVRQMLAGAASAFDCHHKPYGLLCSGWVGAHGPGNLLALRVLGTGGDGRVLDPAVWSYESPVPLFASGAAAAMHGLRDIADPGPAARAAMARIASSRARSAVPLVPGWGRPPGRKSTRGNPAGGPPGGAPGRIA